MFAEIFSQVTGQIEITEEMKKQGITEDMLKMSMDLSKADIEMNFKEGGLYSQKADMAMSMEVMGQKIDASIVMDVAATKAGDAVEVSYPSDLDSYKTLEELGTETEKPADTEKKDDAAADKKEEAENNKKDDAASDKKDNAASDKAE